MQHLVYIAFMNEPFHILLKVNHMYMSGYIFRARTALVFESMCVSYVSEHGNTVAHSAAAGGQGGVFQLRRQTQRQPDHHQCCGGNTSRNSKEGWAPNSYGQSRLVYFRHVTCRRTGYSPSMAIVNIFNFRTSD